MGEATGVNNGMRVQLLIMIAGVNLMYVEFKFVCLFVIFNGPIQNKSNKGLMLELSSRFDNAHIY